jgi:hypothetical protein
VNPPKIKLFHRRVSDELLLRNAAEKNEPAGDRPKNGLTRFRSNERQDIVVGVVNHRALEEDRPVHVVRQILLECRHLRQLNRWRIRTESIGSKEKQLQTPTITLQDKNTLFVKGAKTKESAAPEKIPK